jgi:tyrosyl-tRNA synthetase
MPSNDVPLISPSAATRFVLDEPAMSTPKSAFLIAAHERGFIHQCTDETALDALLAAGPVAAYLGYDCTADSLHIGHLVGIMLLRLYQQSGHKPIALMGGGTTRIGDPSFRDEARPLLDDAQIAQNMAGIRKTFAKFLAFGEGPTDAVMVNNADWLDELRYIPLLRDIGRHFSVNRMLTQDSVKIRLEREQPMTFLEFNYPILQAYDFVELSRRFNCLLQLGGSDQWGNIVAGVDLGRRVVNKTLFGLTTPLMTTSSGAKMGKSLGGAVWLNAERLSPYEYWQYWRNTEDADVGRFLKLFTELPLAEIARLEKLGGSEINEAKIELANKATELCHGLEAAAKAAATAGAVFTVQLSARGMVAGTGQAALTLADSALPQIPIPKDTLGRGIPAFELFVRSGLAASNGEARRLIRGGGARANNAIVTSETQLLSDADLENGIIKLSVGRKRHVVVRPE